MILQLKPRGGSRTAATSKMERFVIAGNGFQPLTAITKRSILDVAAALDPPLKATECFDSVFSKVDIYLANELCLGKVQDLVPIPARHIDLYMNREKLLENLNWKNELRSKFIEAYSLTM